MVLCAVFVQSCFAVFWYQYYCGNMNTNLRPDTADDTIQL